MLPIPKLDDKTFSQLVKEARKSIPRYTKEWTDHNTHDPGITFIELFSWLTDMQHFYLDQVRKENFLKFLKLLGTKPLEARPAKADVTFCLDEARDLTVPKGTKLSNGDIIFETEEPILVVSTKLEKVISFDSSSVSDHSTENMIGYPPFYAFGETAEEGSRMYLGFDQPFPEGKEISITFDLFESDLTTAEKHGDKKHQIVPSVFLIWEYFSFNEGGKWLPLTISNDHTRMLSRSGRIRFIGPRDLQKSKVYPANDKERYWIRSKVIQSGYEFPPKFNFIQLNTISVIQRDTQNKESWSSNGLPNQMFSLGHSLVVPESLILQVEEKTRDGLNWKYWKRVDDFDSSNPDDRHFVLNTESGEIFFGDGVNGAIPPVPEQENQNNIRINTYQTTVGQKGNVEAKSISKIIGPFNGMERVKVENRLPASGGKDKETLEEAKFRIRKEWNKNDRAVTSEDFEKLALSTPGLRVARAKAFPLIGPPHFTILEEKKASVTVVIVPCSKKSKPVPSEGYLKAVLHHLDNHRLITTQLHVIPPEYVKVSVKADVSTSPGADPAGVIKMVEEALNHFLRPLSESSEGEGWPFGRAVYRSEVYEVIEKVNGVVCVQKVRLIGEGSGITQDDKGNVLIRPIGLVYPGNHKIEIVPLSRKMEQKDGGCEHDHRR